MWNCVHRNWLKLTLGYSRNTFLSKMQDFSVKATMKSSACVNFKSVKKSLMCKISHTGFKYIFVESVKSFLTPVMPAHNNESQMKNQFSFISFVAWNWRTTLATGFGFNCIHGWQSFSNVCIAHFFVIVCKCDGSYIGVCLPHDWLVSAQPMFLMYTCSQIFLKLC